MSNNLRPRAVRAFAAAAWLTVSCGLSLLWRPCRADSITGLIIPATVSFAVTNVTASTIGSPFQISYTGTTKVNGQELHISVKANAVNCTTPGGGTSIPASSFSWTTANAINGSAFGGTLSTLYTQVYASVTSPGKTDGSFNMTWTLAPPPAGIYAGSHTLTMTWKLESF